LRKEVHSEDKNRLLNMNEMEYVEYLASKYRVDPLVLYFDQVSISSREIMIPAERLPREFYDIDEGRSYRKQVVTYHIPFSGEAALLRCKPSPQILWSMEVDASVSSISFDVIYWSDNLEQIKREAEGNISHIRQQAEYVAKQVQSFNDALEKAICEIVQARKAEHLKQSNLLAQLGVPIKRVENVPATFAVPTVKKKVIVRPSALNSAYTPEPTLDEPLYQEILRICHETGVEMERHPNIYQGKDEETLRDHFIMVLSPHFQSVTGETFNKSGKTDILIRHDKSNIFVAECKFWSGLKTFLQAVD
jgi:DNA-binding transcriptional regulator YiaG